MRNPVMHNIPQTAHSEMLKDIFRYQGDLFLFLFSGDKFWVWPVRFPD